MQPVDSMLGTFGGSYSSPFGLGSVFSPHLLGLMLLQSLPQYKSPWELMVVHPRPSFGQDVVTSPGYFWHSKAQICLSCFGITSPSSTPAYLRLKKCSPRSYRYLERWQKFTSIGLDLQWPPWGPFHLDKMVHLEKMLESEGSQSGQGEWDGYFNW